MIWRTRSSVSGPPVLVLELILPDVDPAPREPELPLLPKLEFVPMFTPGTAPGTPGAPGLLGVPLIPGPTLR
jgi:hypothetical protein